MSTMYVTSNKSGKIIATITGPDAPGRNANRFHEEIFEDRFGSNDYSNSFTDFGSPYSRSVKEIKFDDNGVIKA